MYAPLASPRIHTLWVALIATLAVVLPALPANAAGADDVTWTVRTASNDLGSDRTNFTYTVDPGGSLSDALVVANHGEDPVVLSVYAADGFTSDDGLLSLLVSGEPSRAVGAWITPQTGTVTVAPGATVTVPFTVTVPADATPGDYAGGVITSLTVPDAATGVNVDRRLGMRVNLRVGGDLAPALAIEDMSVSWNGGLNPFAGGDATVTYTLHNTGNAALAAQTGGQVGGPFGWFAVDAPAGDAVPELLPGERWTRTVTVPGVAPLFALVATTTVTPVVVDASGSTTPISAVTSTAMGAAIPWSALVLVLLLGAGAYLFFRHRRRTRAIVKAREDARVAQAITEALDAERAKSATIPAG